MVKVKYSYDWKLNNSYFTKDKGKVFSCFACGGGSTMGYKLAGFDVIGMNELDEKVAKCYIENHKPKYSYIEDIRTFKLRNDLPQELFELDILDGSPPCSSFSMSGNREKDWGKEKKFREGQKKQILDNLFFEFIALGKRLQPKIIIAENVKGLIMGEARKYVTQIGLAFEDAGYYVIKELLDASKMGVPQRRERVFFIAMRKDLVDKFDTCQDMFNPMPKLDLYFNINEIIFGDVKENVFNRKNVSDYYLKHWGNAGLNGRAETNKNNTFGFFYKAFNNLVCATVMASGAEFSIEEKPLLLTNNEYCKIGSYPLDYNFLNNKTQYIIGMSVPPVMMAQIATRISGQWLNKLN